MQDLYKLVERNSEIMLEVGGLLKRYIEIEEAKKRQSKWLDPEEAAQELGLNLTASNYHRRRLNEIVELHGVRVINTRPRSYSREDICTLARKILEGKIVI